MPSDLQYVSALEAIVRRGLHPRKRAMLLFHRAAPKHTVTMTMLAEHVGYRTFSAVNLHYGRLAADLARLGEFSFPDRRFAVSAIGAWRQLPPHPSGHFSFAMHPELVAAVDKVLGAAPRNAGKRPRRKGGA
jgi:hypothetical protein